jgi:hypothetical protein
MHSIQELGMYLNIQVLGTYMPGIYVVLSLRVYTKYKIINNELVH